MTEPKSDSTTKPKAQSQSLDGPEGKIQEGNYQPMTKHLSAMPTAKCDLSTHLCITIRWGAPPPRYLPVTNGGGLPRTAVRVTLDVRHGRAGGGPC